MESSKPVFRAKIDIFMPLFIGRYLQDTAQLDATESGAYLHLLMHEWVNGPLPNDQKRLARIAKMPLDAWSIANASVMHFFKLGSDGLWRQIFCERLKDEWMGKRLKAHEKAVNAARARWSKRKAKIGGKVDAPSIASAELEQCPITSTSTNPLGDSLRSSPLPPTGIDGPMPQASKPAPGRKPSDQKAKTPLDAQGAHGSNQTMGNPHPTPAAAAVPGQGSIAPGVNGAVRPAKTPAGSDRRFAQFRDEVSRWWAAHNPAGQPCPWIRADRKALTQFLEGAPSIELEEFKRLLYNRADSDVLPSVPPRKWLGDLLEYSAGPLDRYKHPLRSHRVI